MSDAFSLTTGGPFYRILTKLRLREPSNAGRAWWLGFFVWLPLVAVEGARRLLGAVPDTTLFDLSLHVRLLVTLPLLLVFEGLLEKSGRAAIDSFTHGRFCDRAALDAILERAARLRDSWRIELVLFAIAITSGQLVLWGVLGATGVFHGSVAVSSLSFPRIWYGFVALPLVQFVMFRWLWRWLIWSYVLARISRQPLAILTTHADYAGGLGCLAKPIPGFAGFVLATSAIVSSAWSTQVLAGRATVPQLLPQIVVFLIIALVVAVAPYLALTGQLLAARRRTLTQYGELVRMYTLSFHERWVVPRQPTLPAQALGTPDIQSFADLGHVYQVASKTRVVAFGPRAVFVVWFAGLLPAIPMLASTLPFEKVLARIISTVLGGLPL